MAMKESKQPIVVKRIVKKAAHHGGAWKIAFADFATAMMAFFLVLWILSTTTKEQKAAISEYFNNPSAFAGVSTSPSQSQGEGTGSAASIIDFEGAIDMAPESPQSVLLDPNQIEQVAAQQELQRLKAFKDSLETAIDQNALLSSFKEQLLIDITSEGLRIQIVDKENRPMFDLGSNHLKPYTIDLLKELGQLINQVPNRVSLTGHTDARPLTGDYSNWELSTERANAARRMLIEGGMQAEKIGRVVGLAETVPFDKSDPNNPINRRISLIVMNKKTDAAIQQDSQLPPSELPSLLAPRMID